VNKIYTSKKLLLYINKCQVCTFPFDVGKCWPVTESLQDIHLVCMVKCSCFALDVGIHIFMFQALFMHLIDTYTHRLVLYKESYLHLALQCLLFLPNCKLFMGEVMCFGRQTWAATWYMSGSVLSYKIPVTMLIIAMHVNVLHCLLKALCCLLRMKPLITIFGILTLTGNRIFILCSNDFTCYTVCKSLHPENLKFLNSFFLWACMIALMCAHVCVCVCVCTCANQWEYLSHLNYSGEFLILTVGMIA
jgi:hypothetical protein